MSEHITAEQLDSSHLGKTLRIALTQAQAEDVLTGVTHRAAMVDDSTICVRRVVPGRVETTLTFMELGDITCEPGRIVTIID